MGGPDALAPAGSGLSQALLAPAARAAWQRLGARLDGVEDGEKADWEERVKSLVVVQGLVSQCAEALQSQLQVAAGPAASAAQQEQRELLVHEVRSVLSRMRRPLEANLKDLRSSIVRETCKVLAACFDCLGQLFALVAGALLPTLLDLVAGGNKVIAAYADQCCQHMLETVGVSSALPRLVRSASGSKSREMREQCVGYLCIVLRRWGRRQLSRHVVLLQDALVQLLRDASTTVRERARDCFACFAKHFPEEAQMTVFRTDDRTQRALSKVVQEARRAEGKDSDSVVSGASCIGGAAGGGTLLAQRGAGPRRASSGSTCSGGSFDSGAIYAWVEGTRGKAQNVVDELDEPDELDSRTTAPHEQSRSAAQQREREPGSSRDFGRAAPPDVCDWRVESKREVADEGPDTPCENQPRKPEPQPQPQPQQAQVQQAQPYQAQPQQTQPKQQRQQQLQPQLQPQPPSKDIAVAPASAAQENRTDGASSATAAGKPAALRALIATHRVFIDQLITDLAGELETLKRFEAADKCDLNAEAGAEACQQYALALERSLARHHDNLKRMRTVL
jgi:hypothetical protein